MKYIMLFAIISLLILSSCTIQQSPPQNASTEQINNKSFDNFRVAYQANYTSSAGTRTLNINYSVDQGTIYYCEGTYSTFLINQNTTQQCSVSDLLNNTYNVPLVLPTVYDPTNVSGTVQNGPSQYSWSIYE